MKKYIISLLILSALCTSQHISTMNISRRVAQPVTTRTLQPVATKTLTKVVTVPYNYGRQYLNQGAQLTKKGVHKVLEVWEHPLYHDFIDPIYSAMEIRHGWFQHKYEQLMHIKEYLTSDGHQHDANHVGTDLQTSDIATILPVKVPQKTMQLYQFAMKRYEHAYKKFMENKDNPDDIFAYEELERASNNLYLIMNEIQEIIATEPVSEPKNKQTGLINLNQLNNIDLKGLIPDNLKPKQLIPDKKPLLPTTKPTLQGPAILKPD